MLLFKTSNSDGNYKTQSRLINLAASAKRYSVLIAYGIAIRLPSDGLVGGPKVALVRSTIKVKVVWDHPPIRNGICRPKSYILQADNEVEVD